MTTLSLFAGAFAVSETVPYPSRVELSDLGTRLLIVSIIIIITIGAVYAGSLLKFLPKGGRLCLTRDSSIQDTLQLFLH